MSRVKRWIDLEPASDQKLANLVEFQLTRLQIAHAVVLRQRQGVSRRALARRVGVSQTLIARLESGRSRDLGLRTLVRILTVLNGDIEVTTRRQDVLERLGVRSVRHLRTGAAEMIRTARDSR